MRNAEVLAKVLLKFIACLLLKQIQGAWNWRAVDFQPSVQGHGNLHLLSQELGVQRRRQHFPLSTRQQEVIHQGGISPLTFSSWTKPLRHYLKDIYKTFINN